MLYLRPYFSKFTISLPLYCVVHICEICVHACTVNGLPKVLWSILLPHKTNDVDVATDLAKIQRNECTQKAKQPTS